MMLGDTTGSVLRGQTWQCPDDHTWVLGFKAHACEGLNKSVISPAQELALKSQGYNTKGGVQAWCAQDPQDVPGSAWLLECYQA